MNYIQTPEPVQKYLLLKDLRSAASNRKFKVSAPIETFSLYMQIPACEPTFSIPSPCCIRNIFPTYNHYKCHTIASPMVSEPRAEEEKKSFSSMEKVTAPEQS